jgi:predicted O-methyltransferase YrrM
VTTLEQMTPVPILQREGEFYVLLRMYAERQPKRVLEIGTYHGGTLYHWLQNAQPGTVVITLDRYSEGIDNRHLYDGWVPEGVDLGIAVGDSRDPAVIAEITAHGPYDWIFIDAGHFYEEVKADWLNYGPMCASGGVVCFHDILYSRGPVWEHVAGLWAEITAEHETTELISDPTTEWHGIGCVFM